MANAAMFSVANAFLTLRERGVKDPFYARLLVRELENTPDRTVGWLWRKEDLGGRSIKSGEEFHLAIHGHGKFTEVDFTWEAPFFAEFAKEVTEADRKRALWFMHQELRISGGTHISLDSFEGEAASWDKPARDFFLVRCGTYFGRPRQPSEDALKWVCNGELFRVPERLRNRVRRSMLTEFRGGQRVTIRRVFDQ